jgi:solute:Na+ symporter, SSS family
MHLFDITVFVVYMFGVIGIGIWFLMRNKGVDDYYVGGRKIGSVHIGLSVVATDVGGGFSIGLGGLGFIMGLAGSWMLFTGLIGAWLSAVILIPRVKNLERFKQFLYLPAVSGKFLQQTRGVSCRHHLSHRIPGVYQLTDTCRSHTGEATFIPHLDRQTALMIMGTIVIIYTAMGGIKAVIYTDTIQWIILMMGLIFIGIPSHILA